MTDKKTQRFTFDPEADGAQVPTLTSLLYKKNVVKTGSSAENGRLGFGSKAEQGDRSRIMTLDPTVTIERPVPTATPPAQHGAPQPGVNTGVSMPGLGLAPELVHSTFSPQAGAVPSMGANPSGPTNRRVVPAAEPYVQGPRLAPTLPAKYPTGATASEGIRTLCQRIAVAGAIVFEPAGSDLFLTKHIVTQHSERVPAWDGMQISTRDFADLWGRLQKYGFAEFSTLGVAGQGNFDRAAFRVAFQLRATEWVTLVRTRQASGDEAIVALITESSVQAHLPSFHSAALAKKAA